MDPDETWRRIKSLRAKGRRRKLSAAEREELRELQGNLADWLRGGGFAPKGMTRRVRENRQRARIEGYFRAR